MQEDIVVVMGGEQEEEEKFIALPKILPGRLHYLDNVVYTSPKRNSFGGRSSSLPTSSPLINLDDLTHL